MFDLVVAAGPDRAPARGVVRAARRSSCGPAPSGQDVATAVFDAHLCVAEYLLYGPTPYEEVIALADELRDAGASASGALRGVAFATALLGEAALLIG